MSDVMTDCGGASSHDLVRQNATKCDTGAIAISLADGNAESSLALGQEQLAAIELLLRGVSVPQAAEELGVHRATIYRWRADAPFRDELNRRQQELRRLAAERLTALLDPAINVLVSELSEPKTAHRAATALLRLATSKGLSDAPAHTE